MAEYQYLIPGGAFVSEDTSLRSALIPGGAFLNMTSVGDPSIPSLSESVAVAMSLPDKGVSLMVSDGKR
jgi:hypothetical protein